MMVIYQACNELISNLGPNSWVSGAPFEYKLGFFELEMIQAIYELHLDVLLQLRVLAANRPGDKTGAA